MVAKEGQLSVKDGAIGASNGSSGRAPAPTATHSCVLSPRLKRRLAAAGEGKYGRMFPGLPALACDEGALIALGRSGAAMDFADAPEGDDQAGGDKVSDNPRIPAGFTFFGQFVAHDITADRSLLHHHASLRAIRNFRTPRLDLECLYGAGPSGNPYLYDARDFDKLLIGVNDEGRPLDLPRNQQGVALVGDPRNDVHQPISQLHLAFLKFHNAVVDAVRAAGATPREEVFAEAQRLVCWHYQWIVTREFLPLTVGQPLLDELLASGPRFYSSEAAPVIPVEFADAAYRFAHSQIRASYRLNAHASGRVFPECAGACPVPDAHALDWRLFFRLDAATPPQASKRIGPQLAHTLMALPESVTGESDIPEHHSLAVRDLLRGRALDLPSGEAVALAMGEAPLTAEEVGLGALGWRGETPLWYYVLREAEVRNRGEYLGPVGGRIVAEVLLGLLDGDAGSYRNAPEEWRPVLPAARVDDFTMADMLRFARAV
jgi:heme peroxidase